ncbi:MAG: ABC transporter permease [Thermoanaerobaculia bacterium]
MESLARQLRAVFRKLSRSPLFTLVSLFTLAVGIGANAAIFSVVNAVLLRPLPYPDSQRLVGVWHTAPGLGLPEFEQSDATYLLYRGHSRVLDDLTIYQETTVNVLHGEAPERLTSAAASASLFSVLGVPPALGRGFMEAEERPGAEPVVVLSHQLWKQSFGADGGILGQTLRVDGVARNIVGVMPAGFHFPSTETQLWLPLTIDPTATQVGNFNYTAVGRLLPDLGPADAVSDLDGLIRRLPELYPDENITAGMIEKAGLATIVRPLREDVVGDVGQVLWILLGSVGFILLIACANVANLFLVRAEGRQQELAVRNALGATRFDVARSFLAESTVLSLAGGVLGLGLAAAGVRGLVALAPDLPRLEEITVDGSVLLSTLAISLFAGLLFGAMPALRQMPDPGAALKEGGRSAMVGHGRLRARNALVVAQIALALILLVGSGLMVRSFAALRRVDPGFDAAGVLTLRVALPDAEYATAEERAAFFETALERIRALPGVQSAAAVSRLPLTPGGSNSAQSFEDFPLEPDEVPPILAIRWASTDYFETLGIPVVSGRAFERDDHKRLRRHVVVSAALAERFWPGQSALGKRLRWGLSNADWSSIVGVVGDVRDDGLEEEPLATVYYPILTPPRDDTDETSAPHSVSFAIRTSTAPKALADGVRRTIWDLDAHLPVANVRTLAAIIADARARTTFTMLLLSIAAGVALLLGAVGLYGVISYLVSQRTRELGVRMALGADRWTVSRMILRHGLGLAGVGIGIGLAGAVAAMPLLKASLYGVSPSDPTTLAAVSTLLLVIALVASLLPARRAAAVDPLEALRYE